MIKSKSLTECSQFSHLMLFNKAASSSGDKVLHIPTDNYKYDLYFHIHGDSHLKVSLWRYNASSWSSDIKDSYLISIDDYIENIGIVDTALTNPSVYSHHGCFWLEQNKVQALFKQLKSLAVKDAVKQPDLFAVA